MKKLSCFGLAVTIVLSLSACGSQTITSTSPQSSEVVAPDNAAEQGEALETVFPDIVDSRINEDTGKTVDIVFTYYVFDDSIVTDEYLQNLLEKQIISMPSNTTIHITW